MAVLPYYFIVIGAILIIAVFLAFILNILERVKTFTPPRYYPLSSHANVKPRQHIPS